MSQSDNDEVPMPAAHPRSWALALLVAGLMLTGCGGDDSRPASPGDAATGASESTEAAEAPAPADPGDTEAADFCDLLTTAEVAAAVGSSMQDGQSFRENTCSWDPVDVSAGAGVGVFYVVYGATTVEAACANHVSGIPDPTAVPGLGDEAHWFVEEAEAFNTGSLSVCLEEGILQVAVSGARSGADLQQVAVAIADPLIPRI